MKQPLSKRVGVFLNQYADMPLVDEALALAHSLDTTCYVICIESDEITLGPLARQHIERLRDKAHQAGAQIVRLPSPHIEDGIITAIELHSITDVVIPGNANSWWQKWRKPKLEKLLSRLWQDLTIHSVEIDHAESAEKRKFSQDKPWRGYTFSILLVLVLTTIVEIIQESLPEYRFNESIYNVSMVYLLAIVFCAIRYGPKPALIAATISFGLYNYFFIPPFYAFGLNQFSDVINFVLFLASSLISALVVTMYKRNMLALVEQENAARSLYELTKDVAGYSHYKDVIVSLGEHLTEIFDSDVVIYIQQDELEQAYPDQTSLSSKHMMANRVMQSQIHHHGERWSWYPISTNRSRIGVLGVSKDELQISHTLVEALCYQSALAIERALMIQESHDIRLQHERESIRSALLSSVSHDLKTPLVSVIGSMSSLRCMKSSLSEDQQQELLDTAIEEAERLNRSIGNILDMTRLESGVIEPNKQWIDVASLFTDSVSRINPLFKAHDIRIEPTHEEICVDPVLFPKVLQNVVENACKYSPEGTTITLSTETDQVQCVLNVTDNGSGIAEDQYERVFDKFSRLEEKDSRSAGTGLGLAICKAIIDIHEGNITLQQNPAGQGLMVSIILPEFRNNDE